jgi:hypothetical protein
VYIGLKIEFSYWYTNWLTNLKIEVDDAYQNKLCGLCGKFNNNQGDDFTSSAGVIEASVEPINGHFYLSLSDPFANSWLFVDPSFQ